MVMPVEIPPQDWSESLLKAIVIGLAVDHGWKVFHLTHDGVKKPQKSAKGFPDLTLARRGTILFLELKKQKGELEPEQEAWRDQLIGHWYLVRPADVTDGFVRDILA